MFGDTKETTEKESTDKAAAEETDKQENDTDTAVRTELAERVSDLKIDVCQMSSLIFTIY